ncbi:MAG: HAMP domain-containing histidine kinase [Clostridia bacterium]|nr:HAMP domain-containing histidine kinase [Clostridia bacterium]
MKRRNFSPFGYFLFFINVAAVVTCAVLVYSAIDGMNTAAIAAIMLAVVVTLAALCTLVDFIRRRFIDGKITDEIASATARMAHGDYSVRLNPRHQYNNYDEYDVIMVNLNSLAAELAKIEMMNSDFISNVSHEIKTPLSVISNYAAALKKGGLDEDTREKYITTLTGASKRLSDLVVNVLKLNKLEHSNIAADLKEFDLAESLRNSILDFEEAVDGKNLQLDCDIDELSLYSDKSLLETVWHNLISNAVKFTPEGGRITVSVKNENGYAVVSVSDTGCGIAGDTGERIFDKFYQGDTSHAQEGNGLGLAMVKRVIDILGGEISVSSKVGEGSTFTVKLKGLK